MSHFIVPELALLIVVALWGIAFGGLMGFMGGFWFGWQRSASPEDR